MRLFESGSYDRSAPVLMLVLSRRERAVCARLARAWSNREIARDMGISVATVNWYVHNLLIATGLRKRGELMLWWLKHGEAAESGDQLPVQHRPDCECDWCED